jgi:HSP20 family molecular chaperone IbpA
MKVPKFLEEIDRLFDEMVRDPWTRKRPTPARIRQPDETHLEVSIPLLGNEPSDLAFALEGQRLTVTLQRRQSRRAAGTAGEVTADQSERIERTFTLPEDADIGSLEARFEGTTLRIRIELRSRRG